MTTEEAMACGYVPKETPDAAPCDGVGQVQNTSSKGDKVGVRYVKCQKCEAVWQVTFKPPPPVEIIGRTPAEPRSDAGRPPRRY